MTKACMKMGQEGKSWMRQFGFIWRFVCRTAFERVFAVEGRVALELYSVDLVEHDASQNKSSPICN